MITIFQLFDFTLKNKQAYTKIIKLECINSSIIPDYNLEEIIPDYNLLEDINSSIIPDNNLLEAQLLPSNFLKNYVIDFPNKNFNLYIQFEKYKLIKKFINNILKISKLNENALNNFFNMNYLYLSPILEMKNLPKYEKIIFEILVKKEYVEMVYMINYLVLVKQTQKRYYFIPKIESGDKDVEYQLGNLVIYSWSDASQYVIRYLGPHWNCYLTLQELIELYQYNDYETNICLNELDLSYHIIYHELSEIRGTEIEVYLDKGLAAKKLKIELNWTEDIKEKLRFNQINLYERSPSKTNLMDLQSAKELILKDYPSSLELLNIEYKQFVEEYNICIYYTFLNYYDNLPNQLKSQILQLKKKIEKNEKLEKLENFTLLIIKLIKSKNKWFKNWIIWWLY